MEEILTPIGDGFTFPENVVGKILEFSDYRSIMTLMKVSKGFRKNIVVQRPDLKITSIEISAKKGAIIFALKYSGDSEILKIQYRERRRYYRQTPRKWKRSLGKFWKKENREQGERFEKKFQGKGCLVKNLNSKNKEHFRKMDFLQAFFLDYNCVLCLQSSKISNFKINFLSYRALVNFSFPIFNYFKVRRRNRIKIQNLSCNFLQNQQIAMILGCLDSDSLEKLEFTEKVVFEYCIIGKTIIQRTPQWKKLKEIDIQDETIYGGLVKDLLHFEKVNVRMEQITLSEIAMLKNAFQTTANPKNFVIKLLCYDSNMLIELLGEPMDYGNQNFSFWFFEIPNSQQYLRISYDSTKKSINFKRLEYSEMLEKFSNALEFSKRAEQNFSFNLQNLTMFAMDFRETLKNRLHTIRLSLNKTNATLELLFFDGYTKMSYDYKDKGLGCEVCLRYAKERKTIETLDFVSALCKDLEKILSFQTQTIQYLRVVLDDESASANNWNESQEVVSRSFLENFENILKSRSQLLEVHFFDMNPIRQNQLLSILPFLDLFKMGLDRLDNNLISLETDRIVKLDQWRNLKKLITENYILNVAMEDLVHFNYAEVTVEEIGPKDVLNLKEMFQNSSKPSLLILHYKYFSGPVEPYECLGRRKTASFKSGIVTQEWNFPILTKIKESENSGDSRQIKMLSIFHRSDKVFSFRSEDLELRRERMTTISEISGMVLWTFAFPWIMEKMLGYADFESILALRKVSHDIRNFIDDPRTRLQLKPVDIYILIYTKAIALKFGYTETELETIYAAVEKIKGRQEEEGCKIGRFENEEETKRSIFLKDTDYVPTAFKDLETMLNLVKSKLKSLCINLVQLNENSNFSKLFKDFLASRKSPLSVEHFKIGIIQKDEGVFEILPFLNPKILKSIEIGNLNYKDGEDVTERMDINRIGDLEQWKSAEELKIVGFMIHNTELENLTHFSKLEVFINLITIENLLALKRVCTQSIKTFSLKYEELEQDSLRDAFGVPHLQTASDNSRQRIWYFRIPDNPEDVVTLVIVLTKSSVTFDRIPISAKPENVLVLN